MGWLPANKILLLGVVNGCNIWRTGLGAPLDWLEAVHSRLGARLWLAPSCSLLHVPVDLAQEGRLDPEIKSWMAFALQKLEELQVLAKALTQGREAVTEALAENAEAFRNLRRATRVRNPAVSVALRDIMPALGKRRQPYPERRAEQAVRVADVETASGSPQWSGTLDIPGSLSESFLMNVDASGSITGSIDEECQITGTVTARADVNVFDISATFQSASDVACTYDGQTLPGIAIVTGSGDLFGALHGADGHIAYTVEASQQLVK